MKDLRIDQEVGEKVVNMCSTRVVFFGIKTQPQSTPSVYIAITARLGDVILKEQTEIVGRAWIFKLTKY